MIPMIKMISAGLTLSVLALTACANAEQPSLQSPDMGAEMAAKKTLSDMTFTTQGQYKKPGASVDFSHDYSGASKSGQTEVVTFMLSEPHDSGTLSLTARADEGLEIYSDVSNLSFDMASGREHRLDVQVGTPIAGTHYLSFTAATDTGSGQRMMRSFSVAFNVDGGAAALKTQQAPKGTRVSGGLVIMDAEETITILD